MKKYRVPQQGERPQKGKVMPKTAKTKTKRKGKRKEEEQRPEQGTQKDELKNATGSKL